MAKIKREYSAGGIVFRQEPEGTLWLVIQPSGDHRWRFPKGQIEKGETSVEAAIREVREEAGIEVEALGKAGNEKFFFRWQKELILKNLVFYLMEYLKEAEAGFGFETEKIDWLPFEEAKERLAFSKEREILGKAKELLEKGI